MSGTTHPCLAEHAVVIGGSLAGLMAARVLSSHFRRVTLIERDHVANRAEPRKGVPQGNHVHGLLLAGQRVLEDLFPDLTPALIAEGAATVDMGRDFRWHHFNVWKVRFDSGLKGLIMTRPLLEFNIAKRVRSLPNVQILEADVQALVLDEGRRRVRGLTVRSTDGERGIDGDLIVDASGRGSQLPHWLERLGCEKPRESSVSANVHYSSRVYRATSEKRDWKALLVSPKAPLKRLAAIFPVEGNRWLVTLGSRDDDIPPRSEEGFLDFTRSIPVPDIYEALARAEPITPIATYRFSKNLRRHYERLSSLPQGLLVIGDAFCSFNPVYGQGISVAALEAAALEEVMRERAGYDPATTPSRFHKKIAGIADVPWRMTTGEDFRYAEAVGARPPGTAFLHWYTGRLHVRCADDSSLALIFFRVMHLIDSPMKLFHPKVITRVIRPRRVAMTQMAAPVTSSLSCKELGQAQ